MSKPDRHEWIDECMHYRGVVLDGEFSHWCLDWDELPVDETCREWPCTCSWPWWKLAWYWLRHPVKALMAL